MKLYKDLTEEDQAHRLSAGFTFGTVSRKDIITTFQGHDDEEERKKIRSDAKNFSDEVMEKIADEMRDICYRDFYGNLEEAFDTYIAAKECEEEE